MGVLTFAPAQLRNKAPEKDVEMQFGFLRLAMVVSVIFGVAKAVGREERPPDVPAAAPRKKHRLERSMRERSS